MTSLPSRRRFLGGLAALGAASVVPSASAAGLFHGKFRFPRPGGPGVRPTAVGAPAVVPGPNCADAAFNLNAWDEVGQTYAVGQAASVTFSGVFPPTLSYGLSVVANGGGASWEAIGGATLSAPLYGMYTKLTFPVMVSGASLAGLANGHLDFSVTPDCLGPCRKSLWSQPVNYS